MKSKCCQAPVRVEGNTTKYYVCESCGEASNITGKEIIDKPEWENEFDKRFCVEIEEYNKEKCSYLTDYIMPKDIKQLISSLLKKERDKVIEEINDIDFYGWNENTQSMIKDKINNLNNKYENN